jgi:hypothetical protein
MPTVDSTAILRIGYDEAANALRITFATGNAYTYAGVPPGIYAEFLQASSKGVFFNANIRDRYPFVQTSHARHRLRHNRASRLHGPAPATAK